MQSTSIAVLDHTTDSNVDLATTTSVANDSGNDSQSASSLILDRSQSPFLASLPWFTDAIIRPDLIPGHISDTFAYHNTLLTNIQLFTNKVKKTENEVTTAPDMPNIGGVHQFNHYFCSLMGIKIAKRKYEKLQYQKFFAKATNIMMMYRLCDIMTWTLCPDDQGIVPQHDKQVFKAPNNTSFHHIHSLKKLIGNANRYLAIETGRENSAQSYVPDDKLSNALNGLWGQFHRFTQKANAFIIRQNLGWGDVKVPDVLRRNDPSQMRLPLFLALAVSPLMLLAPVQWHTKDFNRSALVGIWQCLGNKRPDSIARLEKELWKYLFALADGNVENQEMTLESFLSRAVDEVRYMIHEEDRWFEEEQGGEEVTALQYEIKLATKPRSWPKLLLPPVEGHNMPADDTEGNDVEPNDMDVDSQEDVSQAGTKDKDSDAQESAESVVDTGIVGEVGREECEEPVVDTLVGEVGPAVDADNMEEDLLEGMVPEVDRQEKEGREEGGKENMQHDENMMEEEEQEIPELSDGESEVTDEVREEEAQNMEDDTMGGMDFGYYAGKRRGTERKSRDVSMEEEIDEEEGTYSMRSRGIQQKGRVGQGAVAPSSSYLTPPTPAQRQKAPNPREEESDTSSSEHHALASRGHGAAPRARRAEARFRPRSDRIPLVVVVVVPPLSPIAAAVPFPFLVIVAPHPPTISLLLSSSSPPFTPIIPLPSLFLLIRVITSSLPPIVVILRRLLITLGFRLRLRPDHFPKGAQTHNPLPTPTSTPLLLIPNMQLLDFASAVAVMT
ncbi:hypothetical protein F5887DRAFT_921136 [Amanita rubescens]|nr:hypothetical protein F5887DRAFT_921136 [Amanita rubescens]